MARITTIANQKGGVGKTTTTNSMASILADRGKKVLMIDLDPQGNLTTISVGTNTAESTIYQVFKGEVPAKKAVIKISENLSIIPGSLMMAAADLEFNKMGKEHILRKALEPIKNQFDYIFIDTPPTLGTLTTNALTASTDVIIPIVADLLSLQGLGLILSIINDVIEYSNPQLKISGILLTRYNNQTTVRKQFKSLVEENCQNLNLTLFQHHISEAVAVVEAQANTSSITGFAPKSKPAADYLNVTDEYLTML